MMESPVQESALVVLVPEAEALVGPFRARYDPAARLGVPAHITVLYPFVPPAALDRDVEEVLTGLFRSAPSFNFDLAEIRAFPGVLYLSPEPETPFQQLIAAVCARFPAYPLYGGAFPDPIPHLTVGQTADPGEFERLRHMFIQKAMGRLPLQARAGEVALLENRTGHWRQRAVYLLGG